MKRLIVLLLSIALSLSLSGTMFAQGQVIGPWVDASMPIIDCSAGCSPTATQLQLGAVLNNYGQGAANRVAQLPAIAAGMSFVVDIGTTQAANSFTVTSFTGTNMCLDQNCGTLYTNIIFATPTQYDELSCRSARDGAAGVYIWKCSTAHGTTTGS